MRTSLLLVLVACSGSKADDADIVDADTDTDTDTDTDADTDTDTDADTDSDTDADTDTGPGTGDTGTAAFHASCGPVTVHPNVLRTEWLPQAPISGIGGPDVLLDDVGRVHVLRTDNVVGYHGHHFVDDGTGWVHTPLAPPAATLGAGWTSSGLQAVAYGGAANTTVTLDWTAASGWSVATPAAGVSLFQDPAAVGVSAGDLVALTGDAALGLTRFGAGSPTGQAISASGTEREALAVRPDGTVDALYWSSAGGTWELTHWSSDTATPVGVWDSGSSSLSDARVAVVSDTELFVFFQWQTELWVAHRDALGAWTTSQLLALPAEGCEAPPYTAADTCDLDLGYAAPLVALRTSVGAALVYGVRIQQATLTASKMPGPGGGYLTWDTRPAWEGEVRLATWDPIGGLAVPEVLLDGVVSMAGQAETDGAGAVHVALQDLECAGLYEWATRYAVLDASLVP